MMSNKRIPILSIAAAVGALLPQENANAALRQSTDQRSERHDATSGRNTAVDPADVNVTVDVGGNFLGFVVTKSADGVVMAYHSSHRSHSSHASHRSHFSSR
jgi:hypothetical protein